MPRPSAPPSVAHRLLLGLLFASLLAACGGGSKKTASPTTAKPTTTTAAPTTTAPRADLSWVAKASKQLTEVPVYATADLTAEPQQILAQPNEDGAPLAFLVKGAYDPNKPPTALEVYLPVRPNGSSGFIRTADVELFSHQYKITV